MAISPTGGKPEIVIGVRTDSSQLKADLSRIERDLESLGRLSNQTIRSQMFGERGRRRSGTSIPGAPPPYLSPSHVSLGGFDPRMQWGPTNADIARVKFATDNARDRLKILNDENRVYAEAVRHRLSLAHAERMIRAEQLQRRGVPDALIAQIQQAEKARATFLARLGGRGGGGPPPTTPIDRLTLAFSNLRKQILKVYSAYLVLQTVWTTVKWYAGFMRKLLDIQREMENARIGMAQVSLVAGKFLDDTGKPLPFGQQFQLGLARAQYVLHRILEDSIEFGVNFKDLVKVFPALIGPGLRAKGTLKEIVALTRDISIFGQRIGLQQGQLVRTVDNLLKGFRVENTELGSALGLSNKLVKSWRDQGILVKKLTELFSDFNKTLGENINTYEGQINSIRALLTAIGWEVSDTLFATAKDALETVRDLLMSIRDSPDAMTGISDAVNIAFGTMLNALTYLVENADIIEGIFISIKNFREDPWGTAIRGAAGAFVSGVSGLAPEKRYRTAFMQYLQQKGVIIPETGYTAVPSELYAEGSNIPRPPPREPNKWKTRLDLYRERQRNWTFPWQGGQMIWEAQQAIKAAKTFPEAAMLQEKYQHTLRGLDPNIYDVRTKRIISDEIRYAYAEMRYKFQQAIPEGKEGGTAKDRMNELARSTEELDDAMLNLEERFRSFIQVVVFDGTEAILKALNSINQGKQSLLGALGSYAGKFGRPSEQFLLTDMQQAAEREEYIIRQRQNENEINKNLQLREITGGLIGEAKGTLQRQYGALGAAVGPVEQNQLKKEIAKTSNKIVELETESAKYANEQNMLIGERINLEYEYLALLVKQREELEEQRRVRFNLGEEVSQSLQDLIFGQGDFGDVLKQFGTKLSKSVIGPVFDTTFKQLLGQLDWGIDLKGIADFFGGNETPKAATTGIFGPFNFGVNIFTESVKLFADAVSKFGSGGGGISNIDLSNLQTITEAAISNSNVQDTQAVVNAARGVYDVFVRKAAQQGGGGGSSVQGTVQQIVNLGKMGLKFYEGYQAGGVTGGFKNVLGLGGAVGPAVGTSTSVAGTGVFANVIGGSSSVALGAGGAAAAPTAAGGGGGIGGMFGGLFGGGGAAGGGAAGGAGGALGGAAGGGYLAAVMAIIGAFTGANDRYRKIKYNPYLSEKEHYRQIRSAAYQGSFEILGLGMLGKLFSNEKTQRYFDTKAGRVNEWFINPLGALVRVIGENTGLFQPKTSGSIIGNMLGPMLRDIGIYRNVRGGNARLNIAQNLNYGSPAGPMYPLPGAYTGDFLSNAMGLATPSGIALGRQVKRGDILQNLPMNIRNAIVGAGGAAMLAPEDVLDLLRQFGQKAMGSPVEGALQTMGAYRRGRITQSEAAISLVNIMDVFEELPLAVDKATLALYVFGKDGTMSIKGLERTVQDAKDVISGGISGGLVDAVEDANALTAAETLAKKFTDMFTERVAERLSTSTVFSKNITEAVALAEKAADALARGDTKSADAFLNQARMAFTSGSKQYLSLITQILPSILGFNASVGVYGGGIINPTGQGIPTFQTPTMKTVPGDSGAPMLAWVHGGEKVYNEQYHEKMLAEISRSRKTVPIVNVSVRLDGKDIAKNVIISLDKNTVGTRVPDAGIGIA